MELLQKALFSLPKASLATQAELSKCKSLIQHFWIIITKLEPYNDPRPSTSLKMVQLFDRCDRYVRTDGHHHQK